MKVTFNPIPAVEIDITAEPAEEDWSQLVPRDTSEYDSTQMIEC